MRKTQQTSNNKTSFKGILNLQNQKLPQKKTRSRSIRDRNNTTTNQYTTYSRITQNDNKSIISGVQNDKQEISDKNRKLSMNHDISNISKIQENRSNLSRNQSSIEKIRENMRKQSKQLKQRQRNRSNSRRKRSHNRSKQNSISHPASRFPNPITRQNPSSNQQLPQRTNEKQLMNQIINIKKHINQIQKSYLIINNQLNSNPLDQNSSYSYHNQSNTSIMNQQQELKQKANDLNNLLQSFHIKFKENFTKTTKQLLNKIDQCHQQTQNKENQQVNTTQKQQQKQQFSPNQLNSLFNQIEKQFSIGQSTNSNNSLFQKLQNDSKNIFNDLQKRMILAQQRLLK